MREVQGIKRKRNESEETEVEVNLKIEVLKFIPSTSVSTYELKF